VKIKEQALKDARAKLTNPALRKRLDDRSGNLLKEEPK
jgi:hypothetical protein